MLTDDEISSLAETIKYHHEIIFSDVIKRIESIERKLKKYLYDRPYKCPVCEAKGIAIHGNKCAACSGTGIVWK